VIVLAWTTPVVWVLVAVFAGPSDGTAISPPTAFAGEQRWGESVTVVRSYGETPLQEGDQILAIEGRSLERWVDRPEAIERSVGDDVTYRIRRSSAGLDRVMNLDVQLVRYPLLDALSSALPTVVLLLGLLVSGSFLFWFRSRDVACRAALALGATALAGMTAFPLGLGAIDLAGSRGVWPQLGGEVLLAVGIGSMLLAALSFPWNRSWLRGHPLAWLVPYLVPMAGYLVWATAYATRIEPDAARLQAMIMVATPALLVTVPVIVAVEVHGYARARTREDRVVLRLVLAATTWAVLVRIFLGELPQQQSGRPLVPWEVQSLLLMPALLLWLVAAVMRYRLQEMDGVLRRSLLQVVLATLIGTVFLAVAAAVGIASGSSYWSVVAGGLVALVLLPLALGLRRTVSQFVYGDRDYPYRVVSELRRLDPHTTPTEALRDMLTLLARRLRLSYASIEVYASTAGDRIETSIGESRGQPTAVVLEVGGATLGQLQLEVTPSRESFGPRDRRLLEDIGGQVGAMVQAVTANRELQRSRERLVSAREEERRRVRRDLHDGLGPSLATMAMKLEAAHELIAADPEGAERLVGQLYEQTRSDIVEIRRLVDGLRPPALDQLGLVSALRQRASDHNRTAGIVTGSTPMRWTVQADEDLEPLPAAVEVAAYRIVLESVNNALQHGHASACTVTLGRRAGALEVEVRDDGVGLDGRHGAEDPSERGVGLESMQERAEELGGSCSVTSTPRHGTRILAILPLTEWTDDESARS